MNMIINLHVRTPDILSLLRVCMIIELYWSTVPSFYQELVGTTTS